jgi:flagellar hook protein FlgE
MSVDPLSIGLSGLEAYGEVIGTSANNVANVATPGFRPKSVTLHEVTAGAQPAGVAVATTSSSQTPGTVLSDEFVKMIAAQKAYQANTKTIEAAREDLETVLGIEDAKPPSP